MASGIFSLSGDDSRLPPVDGGSDARRVAQKAADVVREPCTPAVDPLAHEPDQPPLFRPRFVPPPDGTEWS